MIRSVVVDWIRIPALLSLACLGAGRVAAGPVVCTTVPIVSDTFSSSVDPVELTRCVPTQTTDALIEQRFLSWTAPYERGVDALHQLTDLVGIAVGGTDGTRLMGLGFPDQTVIWDAAAVGATIQALIEEQSPALPLRTSDLANGFGSSLAIEASDQSSAAAMVEASPLVPLW